MKVIAKTKDINMGSSPHILQCSICGENNREKLKIEDIGISCGMSGNGYSFCKKCWDSKTLGKDILKLIGYPSGMKLRDDCLDITTHE